MRILVAGDINSIHTRRWASHLAMNNEVYLAYIPLRSVEKSKTMFSDESASRINFVPIVSPLYVNLIRLPRHILRKIFGERFFYKLGMTGFKNAIEFVNPEIVHAHYIPDYGWLASQAGFKPLVLDAWGSNILPFIQDEKTEKTAAKKMFQRSSLVHVGDKAGEKRLIEYGCPPDKIFVQPMGVETTRFSPDFKSAKFRKKILGGEDGQIIISLNSHKKIYDYPTLLKAFPKVLKTVGNVKLMIIGDGEERASLEQLAGKLGIKKHVIFTGRIPHSELHRYLASADIFVDTFYKDMGGGGIGVAVMEAMSCGLPVVAARRPGVHAGVTHESNGLLFGGGNHKELAENLICLASTSELRRQYGEKSRKIALEIGNWERNMAEFENIYRNLIADAKRKDL